MHAMKIRKNQSKHFSRVFLMGWLPSLLLPFLAALSFYLPRIDSTRAPYFDLSEAFAEKVLWLTESGGARGSPVVALLMLVLLLTRQGLTAARRLQEGLIIVMVLAVFAGGGAALNEHVLKAELKIPRPNILALAGNGRSGQLGMTARQFYEVGSKEQRRMPLTLALAKQPEAIPLSQGIRRHWISETGYSFPSGHAYSSVLFAVFFLALAVSLNVGRRLWLFYALLPWAMGVCYSRLVLRLHTPTDIYFGSLQGLIVGFLAWFVAWQLIRRLGRQRF